MKIGGAHIDVFRRVGAEYGRRPLSITMPPPPWMTDGFSQSFTLSYSLTKKSGYLDGIEGQVGIANITSIANRGGLGSGEN